MTHVLVSDAGSDEADWLTLMSILLHFAGSMTVEMSQMIQEEEQASLEGILTVGMRVVVMDLKIFATY